MSRVFCITPKRVKRTNGTVLTPDMVITVTTRQHTTDPFYNGAVEIHEQYMRMHKRVPLCNLHKKGISSYL